MISHGEGPLGKGSRVVLYEQWSDIIVQSDTPAMLLGDFNKDTARGPPCPDRSGDRAVRYTPALGLVHGGAVGRMRTNTL